MKKQPIDPHTLEYTMILLKMEKGFARLKARATALGRRMKESIEWRVA